MQVISKKQKKRARIREYLESIYYLDLPKKGRASQQFISEELGVSVGMVNLVINEMKKEKQRLEKLKYSKKNEKDSISKKIVPLPTRTKPSIPDKFIGIRLPDYEDVIKWIEEHPEYRISQKTFRENPETWTGIGNKILDIAERIMNESEEL